MSLSLKVPSLGIIGVNMTGAASITLSVTLALTNTRFSMLVDCDDSQSF